MIVALIVFVAVGTVAYLLWPVASAVVYVAVLAVGVGWAWDTRTEGDSYSWEARGSTLGQRLAARWRRRAPVGLWDDDEVVMAHYPHVVAARARAAQEAAGLLVEPGTGQDDGTSPGDEPAPIEGVVVRSNRRVQGAA